MIHRARSLVTVLALVAAPMAAQARRRPPPTPADAFYNQTKYTYCDAKMLAGFWKQSMGDAKSRIGMKIKAGGPSLKYLDEELRHARGHAKQDIAAARCSFMDIGLTYDDVERLARLWKTSPTQAKKIVDDKVLAGAEHAIVDMAKKAPAVAEDTVSTFLKQDRFTYCDAKLIAGMWKKSVEDGKAYIGAKLQAKAPDLVEAQLVKARADAAKHPDHRCTLDETEFGYDDAVKLAKLWKMDVAHAKATIEQKVNDGRTAMLRQQLKRR